MIGKVFEDDASGGFDGPVAHDCASQLEVWNLESDVLTVGEPDVVGASEAALEGVGAHGGCELVEAPVLVGLVLGVHVEVGDGRVVRGVLAEDLGAVAELSLESLAEDGVEGFVLAGADVYTAKGKGNHELHSLKVIVSLCCLVEILRSERPNINNPLY